MENLNINGIEYDRRLSEVIQMIHQDYKLPLEDSALVVSFINCLFCGRDTGIAASRFIEACRTYPVDPVTHIKETCRIIQKTTQSPRSGPLIPSDLTNEDLAAMLKMPMRAVPKRKFIAHVAGEYDPDERMQFCVTCGTVLTDYRHAMIPAGHKLPTGLPQGIVYVSTGNPRITQTELVEGDTAEHCKPE